MMWALGALAVVVMAVDDVDLTASAIDEEALVRALSDVEATHATTVVAPMRQTTLNLGLRSDAGTIFRHNMLLRHNAA